VGRAYFVDDRGRGLRATWHAERGLVNLSFWRDDVCVETFRLPIADVPAFVTFLVDGLGQAVATPPTSTSSSVERSA
jgi:hypothetical protein